MAIDRYPKICIRSKNELIKRLSFSKFSKAEASSLVDGVILNFDKYWSDNKSQSDPNKDKYVRSAKYTPLGTLLDKINSAILSPHDKMLPPFIFGGIKEANHVKAAHNLLGVRKERTLLKLDIRRFFEQISYDRVFYFFYRKCKCSKGGAELLASLCCVPTGPKGAISDTRTIARGFATSSRLAVWCNLDAFFRLDWLIKKKLKGKNPRLSIYVDDIGITASRVPKEQMEQLALEIEILLGKYGLPINPNKTVIIAHDQGMEHLGLRLYRNRLSVGVKTKSKMDKAKVKNKKALSPLEKARVSKQINSLNNYKRYVEKSKKD